MAATRTGKRQRAKPKETRARPPAWEDPTPYLLVPAKRERLLAGVREGFPVRLVCAILGINTGTVEGWISEGRTLQAALDRGGDVKPEARALACLALSIAVEKARADASKRVLEVIVDAARAGDTKAAQWWWDRMSHRKYITEQEQAEFGAPKQALEVTGPEGKPAGVVVFLPEVEK